MRRREVLARGCIGTAACVAFLLLPEAVRAQSDNWLEVVERLTGQKPVMSDRVRLAMPAHFPTGYTVPMDIRIDSPMSDADHVRTVRVFAPGNPIIEVAKCNFVPGRSLPRVSTRIRLAKAQHVVAVAEMSDGALLMNHSWVDVASDGCA